MPYTANDTRYDAMTYARCGNAGLRLPRVSLGLWQNFGSADSLDNMQAMLRAAFDCGINCFDMANNYGPVPGAAEEHFGRLFVKDWRCYRDELILTSKAGYRMWPGPYGDGGSRKYLLASLDASLQRTGLDYFDIFYSHRMDPETPLEETMGALADAVRQGKALYAGISNYDGETTARAAAILRELHCPFVANQSRYSILERGIEANGLLPWARENGLGVVAFSPLAQGLLTDRYLHGVPQDSRIGRGLSLRMKPETLTPRLLAALESLNGIAAQRGQTLAQMALAWVLHEPAVASVLIGASSPEQIRENVRAASAQPFSAEELAQIAAAAARAR